MKSESSVPLLEEEKDIEDDEVVLYESASLPPAEWRTHISPTLRRILIAFIAAISVSLVALTVWAWTAFSQTDTSGEPLRFTRDATFQIGIFEDLHFGENAWEQWGPQQDSWSTFVMTQVLEAESPQLVVLNGDLITGDNTYLENSTDYLDMIVAPLVERDLTWASTYGNHDSDFNLSRENILGRERLYLNSRTTQMVFEPLAGVTNYYLPVYPSNGSNIPSLILWFFDSRGGFYYQQQTESGERVGQPGWVDLSVVDWFKTTSSSLTKQYNRTIPSLGFVHIPINASRALQTDSGVDPHRQPGINADYPLAQQGQGWCADGSNDGSCSYGEQDVPFMEAITSTPGFMALFSGHDHGDTWCYQWKDQLSGVSMDGNGVVLCFGQHSGYGGYGSWTRGSRQISVSEGMHGDLEIDTWIRLETGEVVGSVRLNSTYGEDEYRATNNTYTQCPTCD